MCSNKIFQDQQKEKNNSTKEAARLIFTIIKVLNY